jgi:hypothetical protein
MLQGDSTASLIDQEPVLSCGCLVYLFSPTQNKFTSGQCGQMLQQQSGIECCLFNACSRKLPGSLV